MTIMKTNAENKKTAAEKEVKQNSCSKACDRKHDEHPKKCDRTTGKDNNTANKDCTQK